MARKQQRDPDLQLSRRERQIMEVVFRRGRATAVEIHAGIPDPPTLDAVRRMIRILEEKGILKHENDGPRFVYLPTIKPERARISALDRVVQTHFQGSISQAVAALLDSPTATLSAEELAEVQRLIDRAAKEGR